MANKHRADLLELAGKYKRDVVELAKKQSADRLELASRFRVNTMVLSVKHRERLLSLDSEGEGEGLDVNDHTGRVVGEVGASQRRVRKLLVWVGRGCMWMQILCQTANLIPGR